MSVAQKKAALRKQMKMQLAQYCKNAELLQNESEMLCKLISESEQYKKSSVIFGYMNLKTEIDISPLMLLALSQNKKVCIPRVIQGSQSMEFYYLDKNKTLDSQICSGSFNIREPAPFLQCVSLKSDFIKESQILVLTPGLAFDSSKNRLGKGMGFYDIYFSRLEKNCINYTSMGVCFKNQIVSEVPFESNDKKMDKVADSINIF